MKINFSFSLFFSIFLIMSSSSSFLHLSKPPIFIFFISFFSRSSSHTCQYPLPFLSFFLLPLFSYLLIPTTFSFVYSSLFYWLSLPFCFIQFLFIFSFYYSTPHYKLFFRVMQNQPQSPKINYDSLPTRTSSIENLLTSSVYILCHRPFKGIPFYFPNTQSASIW